MADSSPGLASIIAGNDPQSADILQAMHDEQARNYVHDPSNWQGGGLLGGFARVLASAAMPNNTGLVGQIAQNRVAAQPDEAKLMASSDPYAEATANPGKYSPIAMAQLLSGATPASAADARMKAAQAAMFKAKANYAAGAMNSPQPSMYGGASAGAGVQPGGANFGNPADLVGHFESEGLAQKLGISPYDIGFGGSDLSKAPADANGFPMWSGKQGPEGVSHAAGRYQFEPGTWAKYAPAAGVSDFSPESQDKVFQAAYADQGFKPWAPYNPALSLAIAGGAGRGAPAQSGGSSSPQRTASPSAGGESAQVGGPETLVTERSDPALAQQINASPATGAPIPLDGVAQLAAAGGSQAALAQRPGSQAPAPAIAALAAAGQRPPQGGMPPPQPQPAPAPIAPQVPPVGAPGAVTSSAPPGAAPGAIPPPQTLSPAYIQWAQQQARAAAVLGEQAPGFINEAASMPLVGPKAAATAAATLPYDVTKAAIGPTIRGEQARQTSAFNTNLQTNPNALNYSPKDLPLGPGTTEPVPVPASPQHPLPSVLPPLQDAGAIVGSAKQLETKGEEWGKEENIWNGQLQDNSIAVQRLSAMADAMKLVQTGAYTQDLAHFRAGLNAVGVHIADEALPDPAKVQEILKNNFQAAIATMKGTGNSRWTQRELAGAQESMANPDLQPGANLAIMSQAIGTLNWENSKIQDWPQAKQIGWRDPLDFERAWVAHNPLQSVIEQAAKQIGPLRGMPGGPGAPAAQPAYDRAAIEGEMRRRGLLK